MTITARIALVLALVSGVAAAAATPARADVTISIAPSVFEVAAKAGETGTQELTVFNEGDEPFAAQVTIGAIAGVSDEYSAEPWLKVEPAEIQLEPNSETTLTVNISVPDDAAAGGRYAAVTVTTGSGQSEGTGAALAGRLVVPILFTVGRSRDLDRKAEIERLAPVLEQDGRIGFRALMKNTGNIHSPASGTIAVSYADDSKLGSLEFPETNPILPGFEKLLVSQGSLPLERGETYKAAVTISYAGKKLGKATKLTFAMTPTAEVTLRVCENLDRGPTLTLDVNNGSDLGLLPSGVLTLTTAAGDPLGGAPLDQLGIAWPHENTHVSTDLPERLASGDYILTAEVHYGAETPVTVELPFAIGGTGPTTAPICE